MSLETDAMGGADAAREEQVVERDLALAPVEPRVSAFAHRRGDLGGADRPPLAHRAQNRLEQLGLLSRQQAGRFLRELLRPRHPPAQQRLQLERQQRSFVPPVLEQDAITPGPRRGSGSGVSMRGQAVKRGPRVGTQPRKERHVMGATERVDRVQLQQADIVDGPPHPAGIDAALWPRSAHALRSECHAPRLRRAQRDLAAGAHSQDHGVSRGVVSRP
jgi:hypothetical protein